MNKKYILPFALLSSLSLLAVGCGVNIPPEPPKLATVEQLQPTESVEKPPVESTAIEKVADSAEPVYKPEIAQKPVQVISHPLETPATVTKPKPTLPDISWIDFTALKKANPDFYAYFQIPSLGMSFSTVSDKIDKQGFFYLSHDFYGKPDSSGTVFVDKKSDTLGAASNTTYFGHNSEKFGSLDKLLTKTDQTMVYIASSPVSHIGYEVVAAMIINEDDSFYADPNLSKPGAVQDFINRFKANNKLPIPLPDDLKPTDKFVTLSTCYGGVGTTQRLVVIAKQVVGS